MEATSGVTTSSGIVGWIPCLLQITRYPPPLFLYGFFFQACTCAPEHKPGNISPALSCIPTLLSPSTFAFSCPWSENALPFGDNLWQNIAVVRFVLPERVCASPARCCVPLQKPWSPVGRSTSGPIEKRRFPLRSRVRYRTSARYLSRPAGRRRILVPVNLSTSSCVLCRPRRASGKITRSLRPVTVSSDSLAPKAHCSWWDSTGSSTSTRTRRRESTWDTSS